MSATAARVCVGTAGWSLPGAVQAQFTSHGSHLERYARAFNAAEINTTFYRSHRRTTYERWARSVPDGFRFAVKVPKAITHVARLIDAEAPLRAFIDETASLSRTRACVLVQLPPSLEYDAGIARSFFAALRNIYEGEAVCEPRHASWFAAEPSALLMQFDVARAAADPAVVPEAAEPGGFGGIAYWRMHGSPRMYYSSYSDRALEDLARRLRQARSHADSVWCIFDNTTSGAAIENALALRRLLD